jgi:hypothetical protein
VFGTVGAINKYIDPKCMEWTTLKKKVAIVYFCKDFLMLGFQNGGGKNSLYSSAAVTKSLQICQEYVSCSVCR